MPRLQDMLGGGQTDTFLGMPQGDTADIVLFGADSATPYASVGAYCAGGAQAIREGGADYAGPLTRINFDLGGPMVPPEVSVSDAGDLPWTDDAAEMRSRIATRTRTLLDAGRIPVLLGGDDSVPTPMLGEYDRPIHILQIDAHIDWRDEVQGERLGLSSTMRRASEMDHVGTIVQVGQRGVGSAGPDALAGAQAYGATLIPAHELPGGLSRAIAALPEGADVVICFDVDALDPSIMPAVIAPTAGGLSYQDVITLIKGVADRGRIAGFAMVEFMPSGDTDGVGARCAAQFLTTALGIIARQVAATRT
ncbi:MAG: arginase family protein [Rhodobacteraceae bacterium]|nr:arginase family protein [Paracoccaceae bacterium]